MYKYNPNPDLPPETQIGANTFGCKVNGKVLIPQTTSTFCDGCGPILECTYHSNNFAFNIPNYYPQTFFIQATDNSYNQLLSVGMGTTSQNLIEGKTTLLKANKTNASCAYGSYEDYGAAFNDYYTTDKVTGSLYITKLDSVKKIIAGTFNFMAITTTNDTVRVTDGRFDVHYN